MGFRILRVLSPHGDLLQHTAPQMYEWLQAGKEMETMDLKTNGGSRRLRDLAKSASVLVESNLPGKMERLGVGPEQLRAINPSLVYVRIAGYRTNGAAVMPGHDLTYLAAAGVLDRLGPAWKTVPLADVSGAFWSALAVLQGLRAGGGFYEIYMEEASLTLGWPPPPFIDGSKCCYSIYATSQGEVALAALEPHLWERFCAALFRPEWKDAAFTTAHLANSVYRDMCDRFRSRTADEWETWAIKHHIPLRAVRRERPRPARLPWRADRS
jgi:crotonobetainyl-CoA:carnitine CoA-transferase CaiB-like acyl-CoA transferase